MKTLSEEFSEEFKDVSIPYLRIMDNKIDEIVNWINNFEDAIENEQLKKEKEWLINRLLDKMFFNESYLEEEGKGVRKMILESMQQALKKK